MRSNAKASAGPDRDQQRHRKLNAEQRKIELRVFLYRLALTLPGWWPPAGCCFAEAPRHVLALRPGLHLLRPVRILRRAHYTPSYGGVRYVVGIMLTVLVDATRSARWSAIWNASARQTKPDVQRREELPYGTALARLAKGVCGLRAARRPQEREDRLRPHCGIRLFTACSSCGRAGAPSRGSAIHAERVRVPRGTASQLRPQSTL
jgi:hypothetical protein